MNSLLHVNQTSSYFEYWSKQPICIEIMKALQFKSMVAAGVFAQLLLSQLFTSFRVRKKPIDFESLFNLYMFK